MRPGPGPNTEKILKRAMEHIKSVPYGVSLRWLFYRLFQDGIYKKKEVVNGKVISDDYRYKFMWLMSRVRKATQGEWVREGWTPTTLEDDTSEVIELAGFFRDMKDLKARPELVADDIEITFDPFYESERYTVIGFEARAMIKQFRFYTQGVNLFPFGGDAHISPKWKMAKHFEDAFKWYGGKPMQFLYFGDRDDKGEKIYEAAEKDIKKWCKYPIKFERCGLTKKQVNEFNLPENPEAKKPGQYQWEALTDPQAKQIILSAMADNHIDTKLIERKIKEGERVTKQYREMFLKALSKTP